MPLIKAAATRALRTFIQAILGFGSASAVAAILGDADAQAVAVTALVGALVAAGLAFLQGILAGLPEAEVPATTLDALIGFAAANKIDVSGASTDDEALALIQQARKNCAGCPDGDCKEPCAEYATD